MNNKMERFSYEGGCGICTYIGAINYNEEVLAWAVVKYFQFSNKMLLETVVPLIYQRIKLFYTLKLYCISCYVVLSYHAMRNCGIQLFHGTVK